MLVDNTGFEDTISQSGLCSSGILNEILAVTHDNRAWTVHTRKQSNLVHFIFGLSTHVENICNTCK